METAVETSAQKPKPDSARTEDVEVPIWENLKWALLVIGVTVVIWLIANPLLEMLGLDRWLAEQKNS